MSEAQRDRREIGMLWLALPVLLLLGLKILPLVLGTETLYLRDNFTTHLEMKHAQAQAMREGYLPALDPYRAGGQPLLGNPNAVPLYPDNVLYRVAPLLWAFNAHFWLHWLLAPWAVFLLARGFGLPRTAAWVAGTCYALSGYYVSQMAFYNLVAGATVAPLFAASCLVAAEPSGVGRRRAVAVVGVGVCWALLLLSGDPMTAGVGLACGLAAVSVRALRSAVRPRLSWRPVTGIGLALVAGTLLALPQIVEVVRILPLSFRGHWGYGEMTQTVASFDPRQAFEWLLPFAFGRPDRLAEGTFWGQRFYTGIPAFFFSLYPGALAIGLVLAGALPRRRSRADEPPGPAASSAARIWAWMLVGGGLFFALGRFNPLAQWLFGFLPGGSVRYPIKLWLAVALGFSMLCGLGWVRAMGVGGRRRRLAVPLAAYAALTGGLWAALQLAPGPAESVLRGLVPAHFGDAFVTGERYRWSALCLALVGVALASLLALGLARRRRAAAVVLLLAVHTAAQLHFLSPAVATDESDWYRRPAPALEHLPADALAAHGAFVRLFGDSTLQAGAYPSGDTYWLQRRAFFELYPIAGALWNRRYDFNISAEGLDSFFAHIAAADLAGARDDGQRVRALRVWGVDRLLMDRAIDASAAGMVRELATYPSFGHTLRIYEVLDTAPEVAFATAVSRVPAMSEAIEVLRQPGFDPRRSVVLPASGEPAAAGRPEPVRGVMSADGEARARWQVIGRGPESLRVITDSPLPGVLVWQRAFLPLYRATVDGQTAAPVVANSLRLGVEVPAGRHEVRLWVDRRPFQWSLLGTVAGLASLLFLAWRVRRG